MISSSQKKMALQEQETLSQNAPFFLDGLYCEEERFGDDDDGEVEEASEIEKCDREKKQSLFPLTLLEHDLFWEDDELCSLISKEEQAHHCYSGIISDGFLTVARTKAVEWMLRVNAHYGFSALTAVLAVNYFDRFLSSSCFQRDKPWMSQLAAVTCLSLAAKVDETDVPLLLDLQVCCNANSRSVCLLKCHIVLLFLVFLFSHKRAFLCFIRWRRQNMCLKRRRFRGWNFWCSLVFSGR